MRASRCFSFPGEGSFVPMKLEVDEEKKEAMPRRLCVLGKDRLHYKVYALPDMSDE